MMYTTRFGGDEGQREVVVVVVAAVVAVEEVVEVVVRVLVLVRLLVLVLVVTGGEDGIMAMALNFHFKCHGPEGWHFSHRKNPADGGKKTLTQLRAEARLWNQPAWVSSYLNDVVKSRVIRLCKHLPRMESFVFSKEERKEELSAQRKRQRIDEHGTAAYEPQNLSATLWKHLRITTASLSKHVRPGTTPR